MAAFFCQVFFLLSYLVGIFNANHVNHLPNTSYTTFLRTDSTQKLTAAIFSFSYTCPSRTYITAFTYKTGWHIDQLSVSCSDGLSSSPKYGGLAAGGGGPYIMNSSTGFVGLTSFNYIYTSGASFTLGHNELRTTTDEILITPGSTCDEPLDYLGSGSCFRYNSSCGNNQIAIGINGSNSYSNFPNDKLIVNYNFICGDPFATVSPMAAPTKSLFSTTSPTSSSNIKSSNTSQIDSFWKDGIFIGLVIGVGVMLCFVGCSCYVYCFKRSLKQDVHFVDTWEKIPCDISAVGTHITPINWNDLRFPTSNPYDSIIGQGSFGVVIRAKLVTHENADVVVKFIKPTGQREDDKSIIELAYKEFLIVKEAGMKIVHKDAIVKVYGIAEGELPEKLAHMMNVYTAIGIVMRYEGGGTLTDKVHSRIKNGVPSTAVVYMDIQEKLRLITGLARGISELHSANIVHGDIKPDNILLSSDDPPEVRLADFGLSRMREHVVGNTSLNITKHTRGTLLYCAPEMMVNPYEDIATANRHISKATRKTDMYAFALVAWEILTGTKAFEDVKREATLSMKLYQGERPSLSRIPIDCPQKVIDMITSCWDGDRYKRMAAAKCYLILQYEYQRHTHSIVDVCISYHKSNQKICEYIHYRLIQLGLNVCRLDQEDHCEENVYALINSQVLIALINVCYQEDLQCLSELRKAKNTQPSKTILPVFTQADYSKWADVEMYFLCQILSENHKLWDLSHAISISTENKPAVVDDADNDFDIIDYKSLNTDIDGMHMYITDSILGNQRDDYISKVIVTNSSANANTLNGLNLS